MADGKTISIAKVEVSYANMQTKTTDVLTSSLSARFSDSDTLVAEKANKKVMVAAVEQLATIKNEMAVKLRDDGRIDEAKKLLKFNERFLKESADKYDSVKLKEYAKVQAEDADNLEGKNWGTRRKRMVEEQQAVKSQRKK
jgi:Ca-activated chloride channel family protein